MEQGLSTERRRTEVHLPSEIEFEYGCAQSASIMKNENEKQNLESDFPRKQFVVRENEDEVDQSEEKC